MTERRFFIPDTAKDIFEIENSSRFCFIGDFDGGKIYHDTLSENHDLYYVEHALMSKKEMEKYKEMVNCEGDNSGNIDFDTKVMYHRFCHKNIKKGTGALCKELGMMKKEYDNSVRRAMQREN
ncbi:MAG: hypothetical protein HFH72_08655 [Lachnospiraceae bacterium]|nr:hypothetical protein [Lachnospiraceae bacterium]